MQKNLRWKLILILVFMAICIYYFVSPSEKGAPLLSRINLGLDLKGGIHLVLQVMVDDAINQELLQDSSRIAQDLKTKKISFVSTKKGNDYSVDIIGVDPLNESDARTVFDNLSKKYTIKSQTIDGKINFNLVMIGSYARETKESTVRQALETIRRRVDDLGVTEPSLQIYGGSGQEIADQIIVELPGIDDPDRVKDLLSSTAQLEWRLVKKTEGGPWSSVDEAFEKNGGLPEGYDVLIDNEDRGEQSSSGYLVVNSAPVITGKDIKNARRGVDRNGGPAISFFLTSEGSRLFGNATGDHIGERIAIVLDKKVISAPVVRSQIRDDGVIEGHYTVQQAEDLALKIRSGALPARLVKLSERSVGASLGNDSIKSGIMASLIGFGLVVIGMIMYYKHSGLNAVYCLLGNLIVLLGFMGAVGATLTLPGIAGVILTIGMAVDSNILIFERIREELRTGKTIRSAIDTGFAKVFWTIFDTHVTTLASAACLFQFGTGPIKGFAVTLTVGLIANMFTAVYVSHRLFDMMLGNRKVETLSI
jgi:preprotein translocase subunit SecD